MRFILFCAACIACCQSVLAQDDVSDPHVEALVAELVAMTQPDYYITLFAITPNTTEEGCGDLVCKQSSLPVTLIKFEGQRVDDAHVVLAWETSEETNNDYFELERTLNPSRGFTTVAKVKGAGTTALTQSYQHTDPNEYAVYTYYRLKQVDFDGTFTYSTIISIKASDATLTVAAIPNPGQGKNIAFKISGLKVSEQFTSAIYDVRGAVVYADEALRVISEEQIIRPKLPDILPGKYSIKIKSADRQATGSFVIIP